MNLELLKDIENEVKRFSNKLKLTKERLTKDNYAHYGCKEAGALKQTTNKCFSK